MVQTRNEVEFVLTAIKCIVLNTEYQTEQAFKKCLKMAVVLPQNNLITCMLGLEISL